MRTGTFIWLTGLGFVVLWIAVDVWLCRKGKPTITRTVQEASQHTIAIPFMIGLFFGLVFGQLFGQF